MRVETRVASSRTRGVLAIVVPVARADGPGNESEPRRDTRVTAVSTPDPVPDGRDPAWTRPGATERRSGDARRTMTFSAYDLTSRRSVSCGLRISAARQRAAKRESHVAHTAIGIRVESGRSLRVA